MALEDIPKGTEVCISYGNNEDNRHLLFCYGFLDILNDNDFVMLEIEREVKDRKQPII